MLFLFCDALVAKPLVAGLAPVNVRGFGIGTTNVAVPIAAVVVPAKNAVAVRAELAAIPIARLALVDHRVVGAEPLLAFPHWLAALHRAGFAFFRRWAIAVVAGEELAFLAIGRPHPPIPDLFFPECGKSFPAISTAKLVLLRNLHQLVAVFPEPTGDVVVEPFVVVRDFPVGINTGRDLVSVELYHKEPDVFPRR